MPTTWKDLKLNQPYRHDSHRIDVSRSFKSQIAEKWTLETASSVQTFNCSAFIALSSPFDLPIRLALCILNTTPRCSTANSHVNCNMSQMEPPIARLSKRLKLLNQRWFVVPNCGFPRQGKDKHTEFKKSSFFGYVK